MPELRSIADAAPESPPLRRTALGRVGFVLCALLSLVESAAALLPTSVEVRRLIDSGVATLSSMESGGGNDDLLGGKCLVGLALYKAGKKDHPRVASAIEACREGASGMAELDTYSHGLAIIFLAEVAPEKERALIGDYLRGLAAKQKPHGGWGYSTSEAGDTSQTQYAALALWQAYRAGAKVEGPWVRGLIDWLLNTQGPDGEWGYQGVVSTTGTPAPQSEVRPTMVAAAAASLMIGADLHGLLDANLLDEERGTGAERLPSVVRRVVEGGPERPDPLPSAGGPWGRLSDALRAGEGWMDRRPDEMPVQWPCYFLYAQERFESFREVRAGETDLEPPWYDAGVAWLESHQAKPGVWDQQCGPLVDTSFAVLFLIRSTQKSLNSGIGAGAMVSGRGLPKNVAGARLRRGQVVVELDSVGVGDFLAMIEKGESDRLDALSDDPSAVVVGALGESDAQRLEQLLRFGEPDQRFVAANLLGRSGKLDNVPALIFGLTDPEPRVALAARDGLRFIARRPRGFGLPDDFTEDQRYSALEAWKRWYLDLRPEASIDLGR